MSQPAIWYLYIEKLERFHCTASYPCIGLILHVYIMLMSQPAIWYLYIEKLERFHCTAIYPCMGLILPVYVCYCPQMCWRHRNSTLYTYWGLATLVYVTHLASGHMVST